MRTISSALCLAILASACAQVAPPAPTAELAEPLGDAPLPTMAAAFAMIRGDGAPEPYTIAPEGAGFAMTYGDDCRWTNAELFDPAAEWSGRGCRSSDGSQTITASEGELWPLQVGRSKTWDFEGRNSNGASWSGARTCTVAAAEVVVLPAGEIDAFRVECDDPGTRSTSWYAPELGHVVYVTELLKRSNETIVRQWAPVQS